MGLPHSIPWPGGGSTNINCDRSLGYTLFTFATFLCVCVFNNEKAKNDQKHFFFFLKHFLLLCWYLIIAITQNAGRKMKEHFDNLRVEGITPQLGNT